MKKQLLIIFILFGTVELFANDTICLKNNIIEVSNYYYEKNQASLYYLIDSFGNYSLSDLRNKLFKIGITEDEYNQEGKYKSYWFKFILKNCTRDRNFILETGQNYFHSGYTLLLYDITLNGDNKVMNSPEIPDSLKSLKLKDRLPLCFYIDTGQTKTLILNIRPNDSLNNFLPELRLIVTSKAFLDKIEYKERIFYGIILGLILMLLLYHFVLYINLKVKEYLIFSLYCLALTLFYLCASGYGYEFWGNITILRKAPAGLLAVTFYFLFSLYYGDIKSKYRFLAHILIIGFWYTLVLLLIYFAGLLEIPIIKQLFYFLNAYPVNMISAFIFIVFLLISIVPYVKLAIKKDKLSIYFITATIAFIIGVIFYAFKLFTHSESQFISTISLSCGLAIQMLIFALGLNAKINLINKERMVFQKELIDQLKVNTELQDKVNRELEQKVKERTVEIENQKEEISAQRDVLFQQKKDITDSMEYACFIQQALLTSHEVLDNCHLQNFILFKPKDIISGDFYWFKQIKNYLYFTAADCTGHGVPGAFMSVLGISLLNDIVGKRDLNPPAIILNELRKRLKKSLKQDNPNTTSHDGMDITLCLYDLETCKLQFAGAFNPLLLIRNNELIEYEVDRMPVGVHPKDTTEFKNNEIQLQQGEMLYIFSDGYISQFGGLFGKKLNMKQFKELLLEIHHEPLEIQNQILEARLNEWQRNIEQVDDILVIGIRI